MGKQVNTTIGIVGAGFVGTACEIGFASMPEVTDVLVHDKFKPTDSLEDVVLGSDLLFLCLPTPMKEDGSCDTSIIRRVLNQIDRISEESAEKEQYGAITAVVIKSTVPPGTTNRLQREYPNLAIFFNPEFLTEKNFIEDFANQQLVVIGAPKNHYSSALDKVKKFYKAFSEHQKKVHANIQVTDSTTAEMLKYATNCFLAAKVSFMNEIYDISNAVGGNFEELGKLMALDARVGPTHLQVPGPDGYRGFGKSCFPKDINALMAVAMQNDVDPLVLESVWAKNMLVREHYDWEDLAQVNGDYKKEAV